MTRTESNCQEQYHGICSVTPAVFESKPQTPTVIEHKCCSRMMLLTRESISVILDEVNLIFVIWLILGRHTISISDQESPTLQGIKFPHVLSIHSSIHCAHSQSMHAHKVTLLH